MDSDICFWGGANNKNALNYPYDFTFLCHSFFMWHTMETNGNKGINSLALPFHEFVLSRV